jgi:hypothetical protein
MPPISIRICLKKDIAWRLTLRNSLSNENRLTLVSKEISDHSKTSLKGNTNLLNQVFIRTGASFPTFVQLYCRLVVTHGRYRPHTATDRALVFPIAIDICRRWCAGIFWPLWNRKGHVCTCLIRVDVISETILELGSWICTLTLDWWGIWWYRLL